MVLCVDGILLQHFLPKSFTIPLLIMQNAEAIIGHKKKNIVRLDWLENIG